MAQYLYYTMQQLTTAIMKTSTKTIVLLKAFDMELRALLKRDLQNFKTTQNTKNNNESKQLLAA